MDQSSQRPVRRQKFFVDAKVQGALVWRVIAYWAFCLLTITLMILCWRILTGPARMFYTHFDDMWFHLGPALVASLLLLPLVVFDVVRLSNRFAGPLIRMRRAMRALAKGEAPRPIKFRDGDYWQDFADDFNLVAAAVQRARESAAATLEEPASETEELGELVGAGSEN